jgi:putative oxidoreductase
MSLFPSSALHGYNHHIFAGAEASVKPISCRASLQGTPDRRIVMTSLYANLEKARPYILSILRIVVALLFIAHGTQKHFGFPSAGPTMTPLLHVQGAIEIVGGIILLLGAYTRVVAFILAGDMAVAYFMAHFPRSFFPSANGGDAAVLYCFIFFYIVFAGGGAWSVDRMALKQD